MSKKENKIEESKYPYSMEVDGEKYHETGITIRDDFAGRAMQGLLSHGDKWKWEPRELAKFCYDVADGMMIEREARNG